MENQNHQCFYRAHAGALYSQVLVLRAHIQRLEEANRRLSYSSTLRPPLLPPPPLPPYILGSPFNNPSPWTDSHYLSTAPPPPPPPPPRPPSMPRPPPPPPPPPCLPYSPPGMPPPSPSSSSSSSLALRPLSPAPPYPSSSSSSSPAPSRKKKARLQIKPEISEAEIEEKLREAFGTLRSLGDIKKLKTHAHCDVLAENNAKFRRLVEMSPEIEALDQLVGLSGVKNKAFDLVCGALHSRTPVLEHMVLLGPPGVGKSTVMVLLSRLLLSLGVLETDKLVIARRTDLIGRYLGETAGKTQALIDSALGGILVIDEAYSLGHSDQRDSFSKEALDVLCENLTRHKGRLLCIIAGYEKELEDCVFAANPGLKRRFPVKLRLEGYSADELSRIFALMAREGCVLEDMPAIQSYVAEKKARFHGFAGDIESLLAEAKLRAQVRTMRTPLVVGGDIEISLADVQEACDFLFRDRDQSESYHSMYL